MVFVASGCHTALLFCRNCRGYAMDKKTVLNETHRDMGARMVPFGGWDMPVHYAARSFDEHPRSAAGCRHVRRLPHDRGRPARCGVRPFLRRLLANDVDKLKPAGKALYSCMLKPDGGVIDDLIVYS